jgi:hypothetical protein
MVQQSRDITRADIIIHLAAMALADPRGDGYVLISEGKKCGRIAQ